MTVKEHGSALGSVRKSCPVMFMLISSEAEVADLLCGPLLRLK